MAEHYSAKAFSTNSDGEVVVEERPPKILDKEKWDELDKVHEVSSRLDIAVIKKQEEGDYPHTVYDVFYGFDQNVATNGYNAPAVLKDGPSVEYMSDFLCCWAAVSRCTEPFLLVASPTSHGWPTIRDIRNGDEEPCMYHAYCENGNISLFKYDIITETEEPYDPPSLEPSVREILQTQ